MKKLFYLLLTMLLLATSLLAGCGNNTRESAKKDGQLHIVTSFYPMYIATANWEKEKNIFLPIMCVATFILIGGNHCVADMGYFWLADNGLTGIGNVLSVSLGNLIGCNLIPGVKKCIIS